MQPFNFDNINFNRGLIDVDLANRRFIDDALLAKFNSRDALQLPIAEKKQGIAIRLIKGPFTFKEQKDNLGSLNAIPSKLIAYSLKFLAVKDLCAFRQASFATFCLARETFANFAGREESRYKELVSALKGGMRWPQHLVGLRSSQRVLIDLIAQEDSEINIGMIRNGLAWYVINHASEEMKNSKKVGLAIVRKQGILLQYLSDSLKEDAEIALKAIERNDFAFPFIAEKLKKNEAFLIKAAARNPLITLHLDKEILERNAFLKSTYENIKIKDISLLRQMQAVNQSMEEAELSGGLICQTQGLNSQVISSIRR